MRASPGGSLFLILCGMSEAASRRRYKGTPEAMGRPLVLLTLSRRAFLKFDSREKKDEVPLNQDAVIEAEEIVKIFWTLQENLSYTDEQFDTCFDWLDEHLKTNHKMVWGKLTAPQQLDWKMKMAHRCRNLVWVVKDSKKNNAEWLEKTFPWMFCPADAPLADSQPKSPVAAVAVQQASAAAQGDDATADEDKPLATVLPAVAHAVAGDGAKTILTGRVNDTLDVGTPYYGWLVDSNLGYRNYIGTKFEDFEPALPLKIEDLDGIDANDPVVCKWPDGAEAKIPEMKVGKLRKILTTLRSANSAIQTPLYEGQIKRSKHTLKVLQLANHGLVIIIQEQSKQILQIRPDRFGPLPERENDNLHLPNDNPTIQACVNWLKELITDYEEGRILNPAALQKERDVRLKRDNIPKPTMQSRGKGKRGNKSPLGEAETKPAKVVSPKPAKVSRAKLGAFVSRKLRVRAKKPGNQPKEKAHQENDAPKQPQTEPKIAGQKRKKPDNRETAPAAAAAPVLAKKTEPVLAKKTEPVLAKKKQPPRVAEETIAQGAASFVVSDDGPATRASTVGVDLAAGTDGTGGACTPIAASGSAAGAEDVAQTNSSAACPFPAALLRGKGEGAGSEGDVGAKGDADFGSIKEMSTDEYLAFVTSLELGGEDDGDLQDDTMKKLCAIVAPLDDQQKTNVERKRKMMEKLADTGVHESGDTAYQAFTYAKKKDVELAKRYKEASSEPDAITKKKLIRQDFVKTKYSHELKKKTYSLSYRLVDETLGRYMNFGQCVAHQGGWRWKPAVSATKKMFAKAMRLGGKWSKVHKQSELAQILVLDDMHRNIFEEAWSLYEEEFEEGKEIAAESQNHHLEVADTGKSAKAAAAKAKAKAKAAALAKSAGEPGDPPPTASKVTPEKKRLNDVMKKATALKVSLVKHRGLADSLLRSIQGGSTHYSTVSATLFTDLKETQVTIDGKLDDFGQRFLLVEIGQLKKEHNTAVLEGHLNTFMDCEPEVKQLIASYNKITCGAAARGT